MDYILTLPLTTVLPWVWLSVLILCIIIEICSFSLTTVWAAIAALPMIFIGMTPLSWKQQVYIFAVITLIMIIFLRPVILKKLKLGRFNTNNKASSGEEVVVTRRISRFHKGEAKAKNGITWQAKSADRSKIDKDTVCRIKFIKNEILFLEKI